MVNLDLQHLLTAPKTKRQYNESISGRPSKGLPSLKNVLYEPLTLREARLSKNEIVIRFDNDDTGYVACFFLCIRYYACVEYKCVYVYI